MKLDRLRTGDRLIVRNGERGEQIAVVANVARDGTAARVHKWLMRGARWTARVTIYEPDALRFATPEDFRKRRVKGMAPISAN